MSIWDELNDAQLLKSAQEGEIEAFGELYERYMKLIYRFAYVHTNDRLDAEDLTEEVFLRVIRSLSNYREQGVPFAAYLYHIAKNVLIDHHRRTRSSLNDVQLGDGRLLDQMPDSNSKIDGSLEYFELQQLLTRLPEDYRDVLIFRFLSELTPEQTALIMNRSVGAVRVLQHRAITAIRQLMVKDSGGQPYNYKM